MQDQFLNVIDRDEAERRFHAALSLAPLGEEGVPLDQALGRVLARDVVASVDVPSFDRSNFDGFALRAADSFGATEEQPRALMLLTETIATAVVPQMEVGPGQAMAIATGGMLPRGADAVLMIEHADTRGSDLLVRRAVAPGAGVAFAGTDIGAGETILHRGEVLTSRETGVAAAIGAQELHVRRRPRIGVLSTGDEIIAPGEPMTPGRVYDSNARILCDAVRELGGEAVELGIGLDKYDDLRARVHAALRTCDGVLLSGGTSKGEGDISYRVVSEFSDPGIVAHGVALKPGKPLCLAVTQGKPLVVLPGFPTSAIFTFHEFVAPVILTLAGRTREPQAEVQARLAVKINSEVGRTEYVLVGLLPGEPLAAFPMGKGSGSVTTFSRADGFITIARHEELVEAGTLVNVRLLARDLKPADLVVIGSHCLGLDWLLMQLHEQGFTTKVLAVGSTAGLDAVKRGECDVAGMHLLDPPSNTYNMPFLAPELTILGGYGRMQGVAFRVRDKRFKGRTAIDAIRAVQDDSGALMVNRNQGSGTRILIDRLLAGTKPAGYAVQARNHNAVAAAIVQQRADWGLCIETAARQAGLGFLPLSEERYDLVARRDRLLRPAVAALRALLEQPTTRAHLCSLGFLA
jgi:putative molybdopterin biosynthesis protein